MCFTVCFVFAHTDGNKLPCRVKTCLRFCVLSNVPLCLLEYVVSTNLNFLLAKASVGDVMEHYGNAQILLVKQKTSTVDTTLS